MWNLNSWLGIKPSSPALEGGFLTNGPLGKFPLMPFCLESGHPCWAANVCVCVFVSRSVVSDSLWPHVALQASLSMEFSRQEYWSWLPFLSAEDVPNPGIEPGSPTLRADSLPSGPPGKPIELLHWCPITSWVSPGCPRDSLTSSHPNWAYCPSLNLFAL